ncbi:MAG: FadR family transcriptional regulator [Piscinibacter sp.]|nr:FadR family transcriptional regulator [Piscinibacter sp.]
MPLHTIEPRRLYRQIAEQLRTLIRQGEYAVGSRLPAERDLAVQLGVSRPSVREALIALEVEGLVEVRVGSGVHVVAREPSARGLAAAQVEEFGLFEIIRARQLVEGELAAIVARSASPELLRELRGALVRMEDEIAAGAMPIAGDRLFHLLIAQAADNGPLLRMVTQLYDMRNSPLFEKFGHHFEDAASWRKAVAEHRAVVKALAAHDPEAARAAMQRHLQRSHDRFADSWPQVEELAAAAPTG